MRARRVPSSNNIDVSAEPPDPRWVRLSWDARDRHRWVTALAALGLLIAAALAVLGLPPVDLHPPFHRLGIMDPLCGGTRSARYTAMGRFDEAWRYNPLGIVVVAGGALAIVRAVIGFVAGRWLNIAVIWTPRRRRIVIVVAVLLIVALEVRQQLRADLLIAGT